MHIIFCTHLDLSSFIDEIDQELLLDDGIKCNNFNGTLLTVRCERKREKRKKEKKIRDCLLLNGEKNIYVCEQFSLSIDRLIHGLPIR